jgi:membrane protease YdiL (CAAX protease family)
VSDPATDHHAGFVAAPTALLPHARAALVGWLVFAAICIALEVTGVVSGLAVTVPLMLVLIVARLLDAHAGRAALGRALRRLGIVVATVSAVLAAAAFHWRAGMFGLSPFVAVPLLATTGIVSVLMLSRRARALVLRPFGLDPGSAVHVVSVLAFVIALVFTVTAFMESQREVSSDPVPMDVGDALVALVGDGALALAGVGFLQTRGVRATRERLDIRPLGLRAVVGAVLVAAALHAMVAALEEVENVLLPDLAALEDRLDYEFVGISPLLGGIALSIGVGVGEELLFRGALQPRFGIVASAALFAAFHVQYQVPGILMIFLVGLALGIVKRRTSTTFTIVVHILYDAAAFVL